MSDGGPDNEDNAAPLCPSCHEIYGANATKRKLIRQSRDFWYELCSEWRQSGTIVNAESLWKDDPTNSSGFHLRVGPISRSHDEKAKGFGWENIRYSFVREEFVNPLIVQDLIGWQSDGITIASIDLTIANRSNRYYGGFKCRFVNGRTWVEWRAENHESFSYSHVATSPSGIHILECAGRGTGSGVFCDLAFLAFECDRIMEHAAENKIQNRERVLLKIVGAIALGDRYSGSITYADGKLSIGPDEGWFARGEELIREIQVE